MLGYLGLQPGSPRPPPEAWKCGFPMKILSILSIHTKSKNENSIAFGKSTSQRIYHKQHTPKIG